MSSSQYCRVTRSSMSPLPPCSHGPPIERRRSVLVMTLAAQQIVPPTAAWPSCGRQPWQYHSAIFCRRYKHSGPAPRPRQPDSPGRRLRRRPAVLPWLTLAMAGLDLAPHDKWQTSTASSISRWPYFHRPPRPTRKVCTKFVPSRAAADIPADLSTSIPPFSAPPASHWPMPRERCCGSWISSRLCSACSSMS